MIDKHGNRNPTLGHVERCASYAEAPGFGGEAAYRLVSSLAHGMHWSLAGVRHEPVVEVAAPFEAIVSHITANPDTMALVTSWGLDTFAAAVQDAEAYLGSAHPNAEPGQDVPDRNVRRQQFLVTGCRVGSLPILPRGLSLSRPTLASNETRSPTQSDHNRVRSPLAYQSDPYLRSVRWLGTRREPFTMSRAGGFVCSGLEIEPCDGAS